MSIRYVVINFNHHIYPGVRHMFHHGSNDLKMFGGLLLVPRGMTNPLRFF